MKTRLIFLVLLFVVLALNTPVAAQSVTVKVTGFDTGNFPTVRAFISVTDASGHAIQTLSRDAFKMVEDGRDAPIIAVSASQEPIHVGLVIDHSGSMGQENKLSDARIAASAFVDEMRAGRSIHLDVRRHDRSFARFYQRSHPAQERDRANQHSRRDGVLRRGLQLRAQV